MASLKAQMEIALLQSWFQASADDDAEDPTERALHAMLDALGDFEDAIDDASCSARAFQLWERLKAISTLVDKMHGKAAERTEDLTRRNQ